MRASLAALAVALSGACTGGPPASAPGDRGPNHSSPIAATPPGEVAAGGAATPAADASPTGDGAVASAPAVPAGPRLYSVGYITWIYPRPEVREGSYLGYVRAGSSVRLRSTDRVKGLGCSGGFYPVEPRGFVCADRTATTEPDPTFAAAATATTGKEGPFPYRYAFSDGAPMYNRLPTAAEQERLEKIYGPSDVAIELPMFQRSHAELAVDEPIATDGALPSFFAGGSSPRKPPFDLVNQTIPVGSMLSFTRAFEAEGRTWLLSADHTLVPADRVRPFRPSAFRGTAIGKGVDLPIAWVRVDKKPHYRKAGEGIEKTGGFFPVRTFVRLTGESIEAGGEKYLATREIADGAPLYIAERDATVVERETERPPGVKEGQKWFSIRITLGTLTAYDGMTPVYATLVSPGSGGVSVRGQDNVKYSTTPRGTYSVTFKDRAATMSPETGKNRSFWIQDVPHTQYFDPPFALHAAYWHERFGEFVSAGCVNLSPLDAKAMFDWSDPQVPEGWQGATGAGAPGNGPTTAVVVRR